MRSLFYALVTLGLSYVFTYAIIRIAHARRLYDQPDARKMHTRFLPVGGGWAVLGALLPMWLLLLVPLTPFVGLVLAAVLVLAATSWVDDMRSLSPATRFAVQALVITICLYAIPADGHVFGGLLPGWLDRTVAGICWLWFVNLYNFMDGIDGITGMETMTLCFGYALVLAMIDPTAAGIVPPLLLAGAVGGFLIWNWHPSKIILGDVGSVPLGFLTGLMLIDLAMRGQLAAALILPLYYLADATLTLIRRALNGEPVWAAHRRHFYQRAAVGGGSHSAVVVKILVANLMLVVLAVASVQAPAAAMLAAVIVVGGLLAVLARGAQPFDLAPGAQRHAAD